MGIATSSSKTLFLRRELIDILPGYLHEDEIDERLVDRLIRWILPQLLPAIRDVDLEGLVSVQLLNLQLSGEFQNELALWLRDENLGW